MSLLFSPQVLVAIIGIIWLAKVLDSFPSDWSHFHESQENSDRAIQILVWISTIIAAVVAGVIMFSLISTSLTELESWKRI